ncbi:hypothetical protein BDA99DRAFT_501083 [Phascolomyces articulosus]|uniref:Uncharacterized protein n=1 Tax=Phascolomyces articulosus TaxID=60185 RepID=A0AAD5PGV8_9FUNG|nr:hypothetical protein BDA99DRAFT_501083 [Phascolomyces articulosus]
MATQQQQSATKGPAFEIRFCDDNRVQVFDLYGRNDPNAKRLPYEYDENEVLEGKLRYSKLIGYNPPPEDNVATQPSNSRSKTPQANQELLMQSSRYSKSYPLSDHHEEYTQMKVFHNNIREDALLPRGAISNATSTSNMYTSTQQSQQEAYQAPIPSRNYRMTTDIHPPTEAKLADHNDTTSLHGSPRFNAPSSQYPQQQSSNVYLMAPSMASTMIVNDEKYLTGANDHSQKKEERQRQKDGCCCIIS